MGALDCITPYRGTEILLDPDETVMLRKPFELDRSAERLGRVVAAGHPGMFGAPIPPARVLYIPAQPGVWQLEPTLFDPLRYAHAGGPTPLPGTAWNLAPGMQDLPWWKFPADMGFTLTGLLTDLIAGMLERRPNTGSLTSELSGDVAVFPKMVPSVGELPMLRVASGLQVFPSNTGFRVSFPLPPSLLTGPRSLFSFYFGGPTDTTPDYGDGGSFGVHFYNDGTADLKELAADGVTWRDRLLGFRWSGAGQLSGSTHTLDFIPVGGDTLAIRSSASPSSGSSVFSEPVASAQPVRDQWTIYKDAEIVSGISSRSTMTGFGSARLDYRADLRLGVTAWALQYPAPGTDGLLTDEPFSIDAAPLDDQLPLHAYTTDCSLQECAVTGTVYDAATNTALTLSGNTWLIPSGTTQLHTVFRLRASDDQFNTPQLYRAHWYFDGKQSDETGLKLTGGNLRRFSCVGPDIDPSHESANVEIEDLVGDLDLLRQRSRIHTIIRTRYDPNDATKKAILWEGEITRAAGRKQGRPRAAGAGGLGSAVDYPDPAAWHHFDCSGPGMWCRIADQQPLCRRNYASDPTAVPDPQTGQRPPWKLTDVIRDLLHFAGFTDNQIDIQDESSLTEFRLWPTGRDQDLLVVDPAAIIADVLFRICRDYLGRWLIWDPNAKGTGATNPGMWRLLRPTAAGDTPLFAFTTQNTTTGQLHAPAYHVGDASVWIHEQAEENVKAPEFNVLTVTSTGQLLPPAAGEARTSVTVVNQDSVQVPGKPAPNRRGKDFLGRYVGTIWPDKALTTPEALVWAITRIYDVAGHGQYWRNFSAPLALITDSSDPYQVNPRPLRLNDPVTYLGAPAIVRSCNPDYESDRMQMAHYELLLF